MVLGLSFFACAARIAAGPPLPVRETAAYEKSPSLTEEDILATILSKKLKLGECAREESPYSTGTLRLVWDILPTGETANIGVKKKEDAALALSHCLARVIATCRFPASEGGVKTLVFPFKY